MQACKLPTFIVLLLQSVSCSKFSHFSQKGLKSFSLLNFSVASNALCWRNRYFWMWLNVCTKQRFWIKTYFSIKCQIHGNIWLSLSTHIWALYTNNNKSAFGMDGDKTRPKYSHSHLISLGFFVPHHILMPNLTCLKFTAFYWRKIKAQAKHGSWKF